MLAARQIGFFLFINVIAFFPIASTPQKAKGFVVLLGKAKHKVSGNALIADFEVWRLIPCPVNCDPFPCCGGEFPSSLQCPLPKQAGPVQKIPIWTLGAIFKIVLCSLDMSHSHLKLKAEQMGTGDKTQPWHEEERCPTWAPQGSPPAETGQGAQLCSPIARMLPLEIVSHLRLYFS